MLRGKCNITRDATNPLWQRNCYHCSVFAQAQGHRRRTARAKPEVLQSVGLGGVECRVTFEAKESALFEMEKRGGTQRIAALGEHNSTSRPWENRHSPNPNESVAGKSHETLCLSSRERSWPTNLGVLRCANVESLIRVVVATS